MIIPIRCKTCGKVLADKWEYYKKRLAEEKMKSKATQQTANVYNMFETTSKNTILTELGFGTDKICCRSVFLSHVDLIDEV